MANYTVTIKNYGKTYTGKGTSLKEALESIKIPNVTGVSVMTVDNGDTKAERIVNAPNLKRAFNLSPTMREVGIKNLTLLFDI